MTLCDVGTEPPAVVGSKTRQIGIDHRKASKISKLHAWKASAILVHPSIHVQSMGPPVLLGRCNTVGLTNRLDRLQRHVPSSNSKNFQATTFTMSMSSQIITHPEESQAKAPSPGCDS